MMDDETTRPQDKRTKPCGYPDLATKTFGVTRYNNRPVVSNKMSSRAAAFTLAELLVSVGVLVLLVFLATQLLNSAATITTLGHKRMDADSQARELLDRMAIDFAQMVKRVDVTYNLKSSTAATDCMTCSAQPGNDQMAFYSNVPAYYASDSTGSQQSTASIIGYRINVSATTLANRMERLGAGLVWNGVSANNPPNTPIVFWAQLNPWSSAIATNSTLDIIGPQVFRFEYCYLLKGWRDPDTSIHGSILSDTPWDTRNSHNAVGGMQDVSAIVVDVAVIDSKSRVLLNNAKLTTLAGSLTDFASGMLPGQLRTNWQNKLNGIIDPNSPDFDSSMPRSAISGIRLYERFFYLSPPAL